MYFHKINGQVRERKNKKDERKMGKKSGWPPARRGWCATK